MKSRKESENHRKHIVLILFAVLLVLGIILFEYFLYKSGNSSVGSDGTENASNVGLTRKDAERFVKIIGQMDEIYDEYVDESGSVPPENVQVALDSLEKYAKDLQAEKVVLNYSRDDRYLYLAFQNNLTYVRSIPEKDAMGDPNELQASLLFPFNGSDAYFDILNRNLINSMEEWGSILIDSLWDDEVTAETLARSKNDDLYIWIGHGGYTERTSSFLCTGEEITPDNLLKYFMFCSQGYLQMMDGYYAVTPKFVDSYFPEMDGGLVILNACHSGKDAELALAFQDKGAEIVLAYDGAVNCWYSYVLTWSLLRYMNGQGEDGICHTFAEALKLAQEDVGATCNQPPFAELLLDKISKNQNIYDLLEENYAYSMISMHQCSTKAVVYSDVEEEYTLWSGLSGHLLSDNESSSTEEFLVVLSDQTGKEYASLKMQNGMDFIFDRLDNCEGKDCTITVSSASSGEILGTIENITVEKHRRLDVGTLELKQPSGDPPIVENATVENENGNQTNDTDCADEELANIDTYWVIFREGFRNSRIEKSVVTSSADKENLYIIWDKGMTLNNTTGMSKVSQYHLTDSGSWEYDRDYRKLTDWATEIISSNLDVYDADGNLIISASDDTADIYE